MLLYMQYLESARPLMEDKEYEEMEQLVLEFQVRVCVCVSCLIAWLMLTMHCFAQNGPGKKVQRYLQLKSWWASNYVTDWWESYVYLHGRSSIMINSNYYACVRDNVA